MDGEKSEGNPARPEAFATYPFPPHFMKRFVSLRVVATRPRPIIAAK